MIIKTYPIEKEARSNCSRGEKFYISLAKALRYVPVVTILLLKILSSAMDGLRKFDF